MLQDMTPTLNANKVLNEMNLNLLSQDMKSDLIISLFKSQLNLMIKTLVTKFRLQIYISHLLKRK